MTNSIQIEVSGQVLQADLYDTPTARGILNGLPFDGLANVWGEEIYFEIPLQLELEADAREKVQVGELGYWPVGHAFCIFFGPTPASSDNRPRAASPVNILGRVLGDATLFRAVRGGTVVQITRHE
jgi:hypothetical protein